jgi:two-component system, LytTR family, response regulator
MTAILLLEDEAPARAWLERVLARERPGATITALASVADALAWLAAHPPPDLVVADIQLADGLSLEIFEAGTCTAPIIFTTAYDEYVIDAMKRGGIDYLLKPLREADVARALAKHDRLEAHFVERARDRIRELARDLRAPRRLVARRRDGFVVLSLDEVAYFVVDDKLVDVVTRDARRFSVDQTLGQLEADLAGDFFRVNRQYLVRATAVAGFRPFVKGKLFVDLQPVPTSDVIVSQDNAARFRAWLAD